MAQFTIHGEIAIEFDDEEISPEIAMNQVEDMIQSGEIEIDFEVEY